MMVTWKKVIAQSNLIKYDTGLAYLIKIPKNKKGRAFWIPSKCVQFIRKNDYKMILSYTDYFEFRTNDGKTMSVDEFESYFDKYESYFDEYENPVHRPEALDPSKLTIEIDDTLLDKEND